MFLVEYCINNYTLGAKLRMCPTETITEQTRLNGKQTRVVFSLSSVSQFQFINKVFAKRGRIVEGLEEAERQAKERGLSLSDYYNHH